MGHDRNEEIRWNNAICEIRTNVMYINAHSDRIRRQMFLTFNQIGYSSQLYRQCENSILSTLFIFGSFLFAVLTIYKYLYACTKQNNTQKHQQQQQKQQRPLNRTKTIDKKPITRANNIAFYALLLLK